MNDQFKEVAKLSREIIHSIWEKSESSVPLTAEEKRIAAVLRQHDRYENAWGEGNSAANGYSDVKGSNPFLHIHVHLIIEKQLRDGNLPELITAVEKLTDRGMKRHEIIHSVGRVLLEEMYNMMQERRPFDRSRYVEGLKNLVRDDSVERLK